MITFDEKGHIHPYEVIEMSLYDFERIFVKNMEEREHRKRLFSNYLRFIEDFKAAFGITFFQWVDGSFTTTKTTPGDIDIVTFVDYDLFACKLNVINHFHNIGKTEYEIDAHFAITCKWNHRFYQRALSDEAYWKDIFGFSRPDEDGVRQPKGIIKIKF